MDIQTQFYEAIGNNDINNVKSLLKNKRVDPSFKNNWAIRLASEIGLFDLLLLMDMLISLNYFSKIKELILLMKIIALLY